MTTLTIIMFMTVINCVAIKLEGLATWTTIKMATMMMMTIMIMVMTLVRGTGISMTGMIDRHVLDV